MLENLTSNSFKYLKLSEEELSRRGILGRLVGVIADFKHPTRNGRKYNEDLWEKVFDNPIMKEKIANRCVFGELGHPTDRTETDMEKIAICLAEQPKKGKDGKLYGVFDILSTPNGRILDLLCKYGCNIGISSRGSGDTFTDYNGEETVDADTYDCECFDAVLVPAVKEARLEYVTESLNKTRYNKTLKESLQKQIRMASTEDRKVMVEGLNNLGFTLDEEILDEGSHRISCFIIYQSDSEEDVKYYWDADKLWSDDDTIPDDEHQPEPFKCATIDEAKDKFKLFDEIYHIKEQGYRIYYVRQLHMNELDSKNLKYNFEYPPDLVMKIAMKESYNKVHKVETNTAVDNDLAIMEQLLKYIKRNQVLVKKIATLLEQLSVCYAKDNVKDEEILKLKRSIKRLSENTSKISALQEKIACMESLLQEKNNSLNESTEKIEKLTSIVKKNREIRKSINEDLHNQSKEVDSINNRLTEALNDNKSLKEQLEDTKKDLLIKNSLYKKKLQESAKAVDKYKKISIRAVDKYIESQATKLGVSSNEIKNRLPESYTFSDIDKTCDDMQSYKLTMDRLPFQSTRLINEGVRFEVAGKKESIVPKEENYLDDDMDEYLKAFI